MTPMRIGAPVGCARVRVNRLTPLRFVLAFGVVSMLADFVYEGARAITGPFLATFGASAALVGFITGAGEAPSHSYSVCLRSAVRPHRPALGPVHRRLHPDRGRGAAARAHLNALAGRRADHRRAIRQSGPHPRPSPIDEEAHAMNSPTRRDTVLPSPPPAASRHAVPPFTSTAVHPESSDGEVTRQPGATPDS